ncbi:MAG: hypothetical protein ACLRWQ_05720 [Flavonifractor plautii]
MTAAGCYLQVLSDLWEVDTALNTGLEELGVDLSGLTDLAESEKSALAWVFGNAHGLMPITGTLEETLAGRGYLTPMTEPAEGEDSVASTAGKTAACSPCRLRRGGALRRGSGAWPGGRISLPTATARQNADGTWTYEVGRRPRVGAASWPLTGDHEVAPTGDRASVPLFA